MSRMKNFVWIGLAGLAGAVLFHTSYQTQALEEQLSGLNRQIIAEQDAIRVLNAEWSYLNDPARLEKLASTHLMILQPTKAVQLVAAVDVPEKLPGIEGDAMVASVMHVPLPSYKPAYAEPAAPSTPLLLANYAGVP